MSHALSLPEHVPFPERRLHLRRRSAGEVEREGERWTVHLISYQEGDSGDWRGYFAFRPVEERPFELEAATGPLFLEESEQEIARKAKELGRPLLGGLLDSALHMQAKEQADSPFLRRWFHEVLVDNAERLNAQGAAPPEFDQIDSTEGATHTLEQLRSYYASYRLDQVCHFIALVKPEDFEFAVHRIFHDSDGIDFAASDKLQLAMLVVDFIEARLPLPPFEVWVRDFLANQELYENYSHGLHRQGVLS